MNRGTAFKWVEALNNVKDDVKYNNSQIGFTIDKNGHKETYLSPIGVLCKFLDLKGFEQKTILDFDGVTVSNLDWHGETFVLPESWRKKCKIKSQWMDIALDKGNMQGLTGSFYDILDKINPMYDNSKHSDMFKKAGDIIESYYEQM